MEGDRLLLRRARRDGDRLRSGRRRAGGRMSFDDARALADAVLFEGYSLYPYRASAPKNRIRWQ
ncbi:MAG TPA: hypothetical protein VHK47_08410, partial [Polyangia bacterium]|nr:hypothetical protein [Polyangia bacterium]